MIQRSASHPDTAAQPAPRRYPEVLQNKFLQGPKAPMSQPRECRSSAIMTNLTRRFHRATGSLSY